MLSFRRAAMRVSVDNATVSMPGVTDYLADILAALESIEQTLHAMRDALEDDKRAAAVAETLKTLRARLEAK